MKLYDILTILAVLSVLFLCVFIYTYQVPSHINIMCYDPEIEIGFTNGLYVLKTDCTYDEDDGIWTCDEGEYKYCHEKQRYQN